GDGKESPEEDHTYESCPLPPLGERCGVGSAPRPPRPTQGLEVEQMATYEDITPFRDVKAKWTVGEHPGEE
ncbi:UNVERIFIED_CONTAM: hypothetical protein H355_001411, partial [Colinus virginianus]